MAGSEIDTATVSIMLGTIAKRMGAHSVSGQLARLDLATILDTVDEEPIPWAVHGWLAEGEAAILAGEWGSGKSLVALDLAVSLAAGVPWMGYAHVTRPFRVLVVDEENGHRLARHRMRQIIVGRNLTRAQVADLPVAYLCRNAINLDDPKGMAQLRAEIERHKPEFLVMDSLVRFFRGRSENDNSDMSAFFGERIRPLMRDHNLGVVMLDHMGKPSKDGNQDPGHRVRGASDKPGFVDELWTLAGERDQSTRTLTHEKTRWDDLQAPVQTSWHKSEDGTAAWIEAKELRRGCEEAIREALAAAGTEGRCHGEIVDLVKVRAGFDAKHVRRTLGKMHGQGSLQKATEGRKVRYWLKDTLPLTGR
jgi:RecA-family ATPase